MSGYNSKMHFCNRITGSANSFFGKLSECYAVLIYQGCFATHRIAVHVILMWQEDYFQECCCPRDRNSKKKFIYLFRINVIYCTFSPVPVTALSEAKTLIAWTLRQWVRIQLRHGCLSSYIYHHHHHHHHHHSLVTLLSILYKSSC
jgi:hypothetical protein